MTTQNHSTWTNKPFMRRFRTPLTIVMVVVVIFVIVLLLRSKPGVSADQAVPQANNNASETTGKSLAAQGSSKEQSVASAGEINVNEGDITAWLAALAPAWREQLKEHPEVREKWVRERLAEKLLVREAQTKGWAKRPEIARDMQIASEQVLLRSYLQSVSKVPEDYPSKAELTAAYERASAKLQIPARFHLRQIFLSTPSAEPSTIDQVRKQAEEVVTKAQENKAGFADLARQYSQDASSVAAGGDIGTLTLAELTPEVRDIVSALQPGEVSPPIRSSSGFHIILLEERQEARQATQEEVEPQLRVALRQERQRQLAQDYLSHIMDSSTVKVDNAALSKLLTTP